VSLERSDLSYTGIEGCKQAPTGGKTKGQETNRRDSYSFSTQAKHFSSRMTVRFSSPVMRDKKRLCSRLNSANRDAHRDEVRHGEAIGRGGARVREPFPHMLIQHGKDLTLYIGPTPSKPPNIVPNWMISLSYFGFSVL
jgi:hypothetical protein